MAEIASGDHRAQAAAGRSPAAQMDAYLKRMVRAREFSGAVVVARGGRVLLEAGYGLAERERGRRNGAETQFRIPGFPLFDEVAVYQLRDRGRLELDESVCRYLPRCPRQWRPMSVVSLLEAKSGLPDLWRLRAYRRRPPPLAAAVAWMKRQPLRFSPARPGRNVDGSPAPRVLLAYLIGRVSGIGWAPYLQRNVFGPARMHATVLRPSPARRATGYLLPDFRRGRDVEFTTPDPAHGLWTTVGDLLRFDRALGRGTLLAAATREELFPSASHTVLGLHGYDRVQGQVRDGWYTVFGHHAPDRIFVGLLMNGRKATYRFYDIELELARLAARTSGPRRPVTLPAAPVIAFSGELGAITVSSADGSGRVALTAPYAGYGAPVAWSPDGRRLLFNRFAPEGVFVVDANGLNERRIADGQALAWTPDGEAVVSSGSRTWIVSAGGRRRAATAPGIRTARMSLAFSPDGSQVVWTRVAGRLGPNLRTRLLLTNVTTGATRQLRTEPGFYLISANAWSPDGTAIAFTRRPRVGSFDGGMYVTDPEGRTLRRVATGAGHAPAWSPDGRRLAYTLGISCRLRIVTVATGAAVTLPFEGCFPRWRPDG